MSHHDHHMHHAADTAPGDRHAGHHTADFLRKFWVALALSVPIFFYSEMAMDLFGLRGPLFPYWQYVMLALGSSVYFYCGGVFLQSAYRELQNRLPGMMTLISIAITAAYAYSAFSILTGGMHELLFELASLITIMLLGHYIEMRAVSNASGALQELSRLLPDTAEIVRAGGTQTVPLSALSAGDTVLVRPGAKVPADGTVIEGLSDVNESIVTGESQPVGKTAGSAVIAGSINGDGALTVRIDTLGDKTFLAGVMRLVAEAQASKSRLQMLSDRAALWLTVIALIVGAITLVAWLSVGAGAVVAVERLVAVLIIACPHALGLAVPLVAAISTTMAARSGLLVRQRTALEGARTVDTVLFDKTGTLTLGAFSVVAATSDETLALAAAVEAQSEHPIGKAIVAEAAHRNLPLRTMRDFKNVPGEGAQALVDGETVFVGHRGGEDIVVERAGVRVGTITVADTVRPEAAEAVAALKRSGITVVMITGDAPSTATAVAAQLGIDEYLARVRPGDKAEKVRALQETGRVVAMVGDGVNDAPALAQADLGIAIGAGTNVAIESADIILVKSDPRDIPKIFRLSKLTYGKMIQNLFWATGYNVVAIPLAAGALAAYGIVLQPAVAAIFMSASTVIVALNAVLLRRATL